jgi:nicotinamidase-related amidase
MPRSSTRRPGNSAGKTGDLHGSAPDECPVALLIIDMINAFDFEGAAAMLPRALAAAKATAALKQRARKAGVPVVYVNDNFGRWRSDFRSILMHCLRDGVRGKPIAEILKPDEDDYFVLKPKHSGFQFTTLDVLLAHLGAETLILTGVAGNFCVLFTAHDAYMRDYHVVVPSDCVASQTEDDNRHALAHMAKVTKADTRPSSEVDFAALQK